MTARQLGRLTSVIALTMIASCARHHADVPAAANQDAGRAETDASEPSDGQMPDSESPQTALRDAALALPQVELIDGATWPEGLWIGQSQTSLTCPEGKSQRVSLRFEKSSDGTALSGHVVFGDHEQIPEVDPNHGYPVPLIRVDELRCGRDTLYDGYPYTISAATVWPNGRMTVWLSPAELYEDWCVLQTSYQGSPEVDPMHEDEQWDHTCIDLPTTLYRRCKGAPDACPIDFDKFHLCNDHYCHCTESGCRAPAQPTMRLDLVVADQHIEGVVLNTNTYPGVPLQLRWFE